MKTLNL